MPLRVALLFRFNQHITEFARVASHACYRGLLRVLRAHADLPFNICISGTLVHALKWLDPEPLELIRDGLAAGQFELLGSTYAQNVAYVSDDWDNARQIELHRQVLHDTFGLTPTVFWNPGCCWRQSLAPLIAGAGYTMTLAEDHVLAAAGVEAPFVVMTAHEGYQLKVAWVDETLKHRFNYAAWFGRPQQLRAYLAARAAHPQVEQQCLAYAEDAAAMGLWGWKRGILPNHTWRHLDTLLTALEEDGNVLPVHLSEAPAASRDVTFIPDGGAAWMSEALARPEAPRHESGYLDWFDFTRNAPKFKRFSRMYGRLRQRLQEHLDGAPAANHQLRQSALHTYLAYQHEYGSVGIGGKGYRGWEGVRAALAAIRASDWAQRPEPLMLVEDVTGEGHDEIILSDGCDLLVLAPTGGRLLYWFDLKQGVQYVGNQLAVFEDNYYEGDAALAERETMWKPWLPDSYEPNATFADVELVQEARPTRMGVFLPDWIWEGEPETFALPTREMELWEEVPPLGLQQRAMLDHFTVEGETECDPGEGLDYRFQVGRVVFIRHIGRAIRVEKSYTIAAGRVAVRYEVHNQAPAAQRVRLEITNELCPDYAEVVRRGRRALQYVDAGAALRVRNTVTNRAVGIRADRPWRASRCIEALLALEVGQTFELDTPPGGEQTLTVYLAREDIPLSRVQGGPGARVRHVAK